MYIAHNALVEAREELTTRVLSSSTALLRSAQQWAQLATFLQRDALAAAWPGVSDDSAAHRGDACRTPGVFWLNQRSAYAQWLKAGCEILVDTHKHILAETEQNVLIVDKLARSFIDHAQKATPRETESALHTMRSALGNATQTLHDLNLLTMRKVDQARDEVHEILASR